MLQSWNKFNESTFSLDEAQYTGGDCHIFALALSRELGYRMMFIFDEEAFIDDDTIYALAHAYAVDSNNNAFDITGNISKTEEFEGFWNDVDDAYETEDKVVEFLENEYEVNSAEVLEMTKETLDVLFVDKFLHRPKKGQLEECQLFIRQNISKFSE